MIESFKERTAIISGASSGIGLSTLIKFAKNKCNIISFSHKPNPNLDLKIKDISKEFKVDINHHYLDITNSDDIKKFVTLIKEKKININYLVNNAGILENSLVQMTKESSLSKMFQINFNSQVFLTQQILKLMLKSKEPKAIINVASISALDNNLGRFAYSSTKAALISFSHTLFKEVASYGIRVNAIAPGMTNTKLMNENTQKKFIEDTIEKISLKRIAEPEEIANVILFLCSDLSSYINGQTIRVDGGMY
jgi:3-oxoacyl-[acyl-carrier protein] reductase